MNPSFLAHARSVVLMLAVAVVGVPLGSMAAKGPASEKAIPVFPGAKPFSEPDDLEALASVVRSAEPGVRSVSARGFTTSATPEEVLGWYRKQLSPVPRTGDFDSALKPGATGEIQEELVFFKFDEYDDLDGGKARRAKMERDRKPYSPGKWINSAELVWNKRESNGDETWFTVVIQDSSYRVDGSFARKTDITIQRITERPRGLPGALRRSTGTLAPIVLTQNTVEA